MFKNELLFTIETWKKIWFKQIEIQSNAILLSDINYVKKIKELWLSNAMISLHSYISDESDFLTSAPGTFNKTIIWIKNLIDEWIETTLNIVLNKVNYKSLFLYLEYINNNIIWYNDISLSVVVPWKLTKKNNLLPKYSELTKELVKWYE